MLQQVMRLGPCMRWSVQYGIRRNVGVTSVAMAKSQAKMDKVQKLFLDKIKEYTKVSTTGKGMETDPALVKELEREKSKLHTMHGGGDMTKFPEFQFKEIEFEAPQK